MGSPRAVSLGSRICGGLWRPSDARVLVSGGLSGPPLGCRRRTMESGLELGLAGEVGDAGAGVGLRPGSRADFDRLYLACHPRLVRTLTGILGDVSAAEDCTQDAFVPAWKGWARLRPEAPAAAWLYRIVPNVAFSHRRRQKLGNLVDRVLSR